MIYGMLMLALGGLALSAVIFVINLIIVAFMAATGKLND